MFAIVATSLFPFVELKSNDFHTKTLPVKLCWTCMIVAKRFDQKPKHNVFLIWTRIFVFVSFFISFFVRTLVPMHCRCKRGFCTWCHSVMHKLSRTPLDEGSAYRKVLFPTTHNTHKKQKTMPAAGFESAITASLQPQTHFLDCASVCLFYGELKFLWKIHCHSSLEMCMHACM